MSIARNAGALFWPEVVQPCLDGRAAIAQCEIAPAAGDRVDALINRLLPPTGAATDAAIAQVEDAAHGIVGMVDRQGQTS